MCKVCAGLCTWWVVILGSPPNLKKARASPDLTIWPPDRVTSVKLAVSGNLTCKMNSHRPLMNAVTRLGKAEKPEQRRFLNGLIPRHRSREGASAGPLNVSTAHLSPIVPEDLE